MARTYKRDNSGRFAGGGGSSGKKGAATKASDKGRASSLKAKGTTGIGFRVKAKGFGGKKAKATAGGLRTAGGAKGGQVKSIISANKSIRAAGAAKRQKTKAKAASKAGMKPKTGGHAKFAKKASVSSAKAQYKALKSTSRKLARTALYSTGRSAGAKAGGAKNKLNSFLKKRGVSKGKK